MDTNQPDSKTEPKLSDVRPRGDSRVVRSEELLQGGRELIILHGSQTYRLMETRNGKLILQK